MGKRRLFGRILDVLEPATDRIRPPCIYFRDWQCGGCQWQHISYQGQLERKHESVHAAVQQQGLPLSITATHTLSDPWRYRTTAGISLGKRAGFRRHGSLAIVPIRDCPISHPLIGRLMASLNDLLQSGSLPDFRGRLRLEVRVTESAEREGLLVLVRPDEVPRDADLDLLIRTLTSMEEIDGVSLPQSDGSIDAISGSLFGMTHIAGRPIALTAGAFFQTNLQLLPKLITRIRQEAEPLAGKRVADIYAGVGILGLFLAEHAGEVMAIESDPLALEAARLTAGRWGLSNVRFLAGAADEAGEDIASADIVILDPPRAGLTEPVTEALVRHHPPLILYVSCFAPSLARDLAALVPAGYEVPHLELFDFYPQTYHVELLAVLHLSTSGSAIHP